MRALVTGGLGFVGTYLCAALAADRREVMTFDMADGQDVRNYEHVRQVMQDFQPDEVFHLAGMGFVSESLRDPLRALEVNTLGTATVLEAIRNTGSHARVLITGTSEEYGYDTTDVITEDTPLNPRTPYGASKAGATLVAQTYAQHGVPVVCTRAFNHTGPGQSPAYACSAFARRVARVEAHLDDAVHHHGLDATRDFSDVRDVVRAYQAAIGATPGVYNICSGRVVTMFDVLSTLIMKSNQPIPVAPSNAPTGVEVPWFKTSHSKLTAATGWEPMIELETTLGDLLDYWRERL